MFQGYRLDLQLHRMKKRRRKNVKICDRSSHNQIVFALLNPQSRIQFTVCNGISSYYTAYAYLQTPRHLIAAEPVLRNVVHPSLVIDQTYVLQMSYYWSSGWTQDRISYSLRLIFTRTMFWPDGISQTSLYFQINFFLNIVRNDARALFLHQVRGNFCFH